MLENLSNGSPIEGFFNVKDFGAKGDGVADDTTAIQTALDQAFDGVEGWDGVTAIAKAVIYLPPGKYLVTSTLRCRGVPIAGAAINATLIKYVGSGAAIDYVGTREERHLVSIRDLSLSGIDAGNDAFGLNLGHNYRSFGALRRVRIAGFAASGIFFSQDIWNFSATDVYIDNCARLSGAGLASSSDVTDLNGFDWFNLQIEGCGRGRDSGKGGGIDMDVPNQLRKWAFHGGLWEGNSGVAEARFVGPGTVIISGLYTESTPNVRGGLAFTNMTSTLSGCFHAADVDHEGIGLRFSAGVARIINPMFNRDDTFRGGKIVTLDGANVLQI